MKVNGKDIKDISWEDIKNKELIEEEEEEHEEITAGII